MTAPKDPIKTYPSKDGRIEIRYRVGSIRHRETVKADVADNRVAEIRQYLARCQKPLTPREVEEYHAAVALLPTGVSLIDAVKQAVARPVVTFTMLDLIDRYLDHCRTRNLAERSIADRKQHLTAFRYCYFIEQDPAAITWTAVDHYLGCFESPKTANTHRATLVSFFDYWCKISGATINPAKQVEARKVPVKDPVPFTPAQLHALLDAAYRLNHPDVLIFLALGAYTGARAKEIQRLTWDDVWDFLHEVPVDPLVLSSSITKTNRRRLVPTTDALWKVVSHARECVDPADPSTPFVTKRLRRRLAKVAAAAGVEWVDNGLRKGFVSASVTIHGTSRTAAWAGHSESVLESNYKALVSEEDAKAWFSTYQPKP
jgi:integrase